MAGEQSATTVAEVRDVESRESEKKGYDVEAGRPRTRRLTKRLSSVLYRFQVYQVNFPIYMMLKKILVSDASSNFLPSCRPPT